MRTTVTLDADVEELLRDAMRRERKSFKAALNEAVRRGLQGQVAEAGAPFVVEARPLGMREGIDPSRLHDVEEEMEEEEFLRKTKALEERLS